MTNEYEKISAKDYSLIRRLESGSPREKRFAELFKQIIIDDDFKQFIKKIREKLKIPVDGFDLENAEHLKLVDKCIEPGGITDGRYVYKPFISLDVIRKGCDNEVDIFLKKKNNYGLEKMHFYHTPFFADIKLPIREYILTGDIVPTDTELIQFSRTFYKEELKEDMVKDPRFYEILKKDGLKPFIMDECIEISFSPYITKKELLQYIEENWSYIKALKNNILGEKKSTIRNKVKKNFFRDVYILHKFEEIKKTGTKYPELKLAYILKKERDIFLSEGAIRSIVSRMRKFVANKNP